MRNPIAGMTAALTVALLSVSVAFAQQPSNLNPFRGGDDSAASSSAPEASGGWLSWPKMPSLQRDPTQPTMLQNMRQGVRTSWKNTTSFLNPWSESAPSQSYSSPIGNSASSSSGAAAETASRPFRFLPNLFGSGEAEESTQPSDVNSFLNQPRVNYR